MNAKELLLECKVRMKIESDYALAQRLELPRARVSEYMLGKVHPDAYALTRIALTLGRDPISLIAEYEAATEKNPTKKAFWQGFTSRAGRAIKGSTLALIFGISLLVGVIGVQNPNGFFRRH